MSGDSIYALSDCNDRLMASHYRLYGLNPYRPKLIDIFSDKETRHYKAAKQAMPEGYAHHLPTYFATTDIQHRQKLI